VRHKLVEVASGFKLASSTLVTGMELADAAQSIHRFSGAAAAFWKADLRSGAGAESVVALFAAVGEVGDLLPSGIWQAPFKVIGSAANAVAFVEHVGDPKERSAGARRYREVMPR
jgi:hypothetical protein